MEKKKLEIEINIPFFCGFYESPLYNSDTLYYEVDENLDEYKEMFGDDVTSDDFDIEWDEYRKDCCKEYIESFLECCPDFVESAEYSELVSPAYYNFETDKLYANVVLSEDWREKILSFMETNKDWVAEKIKKDWTSYDGFLSFMDNTYEDWLNRFKTEEDIRPLIDSQLEACGVEYFDFLLMHAQNAKNFEFFKYSLQRMHPVSIISGWISRSIRPAPCR